MWLVGHWQAPSHHTPCHTPCHTLLPCPRSAPELLLGEHCTPKADIYSFGIVLWEICCNELPVRGQLREPQ